MIALDIPQGVVTFGSSVLAAIAVFGVAAFGFALSIHGRVRRLETQMEPLWSAVVEGSFQPIRNLSRPSNPMSPERWTFLLDKFESKRLTTDEAKELKKAFILKQEEVKKDNNTEAFHALKIGAAELSLQIMDKRRKKKAWWPW